MLERIYAYLGFQFAKLQFRGDIDVVQPLSEFFTGARNVLISLPVGYDEAAIAGNALRVYRERLNHLHLTVINNSTRATSLIDFARCEVVRVDSADINKFSLPTHNLLKRILTREYDVALDMNLDFVLHTAYICKASHAKVRVGFTHAAADLFYNVQFRVDRRSPPQAVFEKFAMCLSMF